MSDLRKPLPVTCNHCKKHHPGAQPSFSPEEVRCSRCEQSVSVTAFHVHTQKCDPIKQLKPIEEVLENNQCKHCKRKFAYEVLQKHQKICEKASKKRPVFDMLQKRMPHLKEDLSMSDYKKSLRLKHKSSKWQKQHVELLKNLREQDSESIYEDYVPCPHCRRMFAPHTAEKHTQKCKDIINRPKPPPSVSSFEDKMNVPARTKSLGYIKTRKELDASWVSQKSPPSKESPSLEFMNRSAAYSNVKCPHCARKFAPRAAERHIPICGNLITRNILRPLGVLHTLSRENNKQQTANKRPLLPLKHRSRSTNRFSEILHERYS